MGSFILHSLSLSGPPCEVGTPFPFYMAEPRLGDLSVFEATQFRGGKAGCLTPDTALWWAHHFWCLKRAEDRTDELKIAVETGLPLAPSFCENNS